jgi:hypothetical protein
MLLRIVPSQRAGPEFRLSALSKRFGLAKKDGGMLDFQEGNFSTAPYLGL